MHLDPGHLREVRRILSFWAPGIPVYAYGSRVHGRNLKPMSDLDLCFKATTPVTDKVMWQVRDAFDVSDLPMRVEIVDWHHLSEEFRAAILPDMTRVEPLAEPA
jgi:uncharacterized protein